MIGGRSIILGGLPVYAYINGGYDGFTGEYWSEVTSIHWVKKDGTPGKKIPDHLWDKASEYDTGLSMLIEYFVSDKEYDYEGED